MSESRIGYMCAVDFKFHLEEDTYPQLIYPSIEILKEKRSCVKECGIATVKVVLEKIEGGTW